MLAGDRYVPTVLESPYLIEGRYMTHNQAVEYLRTGLGWTEVLAIDYLRLLWNDAHKRKK